MASAKRDRGLKFVFISNLYPPVWIGGYEQVCFDVAEGLRQRGHAVRVVTSRARRGEVVGEEPDVERMLYLRDNWTRAADRRSAGTGPNRLAVEWHNFRAVRRTVDAIAPDVVMFWHGGNMGRAILSAPGRAQRTVYYLHDPWLAGHLMRHRSSAGRSLARSLYHVGLLGLGIGNGRIRTGHLVFSSEALRAQYRALGIDIDSSTVVHNGLSPIGATFQPPHLLRADGSARRILYSGRITAEKGVSTLIRALGRVRTFAGLDQTRLTLLGAIHQEAFGRSLRRLIDDLGLADAVDFEPPRSRSALVEVYHEHDVLAFPSEWQEPFSLILLLAMATGIPVVATATGGTAEIVRDGENALTVAAGDATDLAEKLRWVLEHPIESAAMGERASREVRRQWSFESQLDRLEQYLAAVAGIPPAWSGAV